MKKRCESHTLIPFQCPQCHCERHDKIKTKKGDANDEMFEVEITPATLDTSSSRALGTFTNHMTNIQCK